MAISPVSSVSFNTSNLNFEGKKKEKSGSGVHIPNSIKAVPLATLIALSPLNTVDAKDVIAGGHTKIETVRKNDGSLYTTFEYTDNYAVPSAMPKGVDVLFESTKSTTGMPESVRFSFNENRATRTYVEDVLTDVVIKKRKNMAVKELKVVNVTRKNLNGTESKFKEYYAVGDLRTFKSTIRKDDEKQIGKTDISLDKNAEVEIYKEFYDNLADTMGDNITYTTENRTTKEHNSLF